MVKQEAEERNCAVTALHCITFNLKWKNADEALPTLYKHCVSYSI